MNLAFCMYKSHIGTIVLYTSFLKHGNVFMDHVIGAISKVYSYREIKERRKSRTRKSSWIKSIKLLFVSSSLFNLCSLAHVIL